MKFKVKLDLPLILTFIVILAVLAIPVVLYFPTAISLLFVLCIFLVIVGICTFTYNIKQDRLVIRFGVFGWSFKLNSIKAMQPMKKPYRFKLIYGKNSMTVLSVDDPEGFTAALKAKLISTPPASR